MMMVLLQKEFHRTVCENAVLKPRFLREVSPFSYLGRTQGLAGKGASINDVRFYGGSEMTQKIGH